MSEPVTIECSTYVWASVISTLHKLAHETVDLERSKWYRGLAGHIRDSQPVGADASFVSYKVAFQQATADWLRRNFDLFEMNQPADNTKAVSEAARRLRRQMAGGEISAD